ncbi:unnamed protein product, partial [Tetraodon nigroviridis]
ASADPAAANPPARLAVRSPRRRWTASWSPSPRSTPSPLLPTSTTTSSSRTTPPETPPWTRTTSWTTTAGGGCGRRWRCSTCARPPTCGSGGGCSPSTTPSRASARTSPRCPTRSGCPRWTRCAWPSATSTSWRSSCSPTSPSGAAAARATRSRGRSSSVTGGRVSPGRAARASAQSQNLTVRVFFSRISLPERPGLRPAAAGRPLPVLVGREAAPRAEHHPHGQGVDARGPAEGARQGAAGRHRKRASLRARGLNKQTDRQTNKQTNKPTKVPFVGHVKL